MGGIDDAKAYILQALQSGKHVVTANKDLMALHGAELLAVAKDNKADLFYEASVAGGIPILRSIVEGLSSDLYYESNGNCKWNDKFYFDENVR